MHFAAVPLLVSCCLCSANDVFATSAWWWPQLRPPRQKFPSPIGVNLETTDNSISVPIMSLRPLHNANEHVWHRTSPAAAAGVTAPDGRARVKIPSVRGHGGETPSVPFINDFDRGAQGTDAAANPNPTMTAAVGVGGSVNPGEVVPREYTAHFRDEYGAGRTGGQQLPYAPIAQELVINGSRWHGQQQ